MRSTGVIRGTPGANFTPLLGALALVAIVAGIVLTVLSISGVWTSELALTVSGILSLAAVLLAAVVFAGRVVRPLRARRPLTQRQKVGLALVAALIAVFLLPIAMSWGYAWLIYLALLVAAFAFFGRSAARRVRRGPAPPTAPVVTRTTVSTKGKGRTAVARVCSVLALASLAGGSALLALGSVVLDDLEGRTFLVLSVWPPTFVLAWALGTAAFMAKGTLDPSAAALAFVVGFLGGWILLLFVIATRGLAAVLLPALNVAAIYFVTRRFWRSEPEPADAVGTGAT